jgi:mannose-6-phosphate isomerase-like protein (cupin superfamily)
MVFAPWLSIPKATASLCIRRRRESILSIAGNRRRWGNRTPAGIAAGTIHLAVQAWHARGKTLRAARTDPQTPHEPDEIYVVISGTGEFVCEGKRQKFDPHDFLFVSAGIEHRFENFSDHLAVGVLFYGPEGSEHGS